MTNLDIAQVAIFLAALILVTAPLGAFMYRVYQGEGHFLGPVLGWLETGIYRASGIDPQEEMDWKAYLKALLAFNLVGILVVFVLQLLQAHLPLNPQGQPAPSWHLAFNAAVSFVTNTNWQSYSGETTMSYFTQMLGLAVQNFLSAATGMAALLALTRGIARRSPGGLGNFWVDLTRSVVFILLPLSLILAMILVWQGVVQNFHPYIEAIGLEGGKQLLPMGPAASQIAIKQLGTNGGGFFNANSAFPFENPTPLANWLEMFVILMIPAALTYTYGKMVGSVRQGWVIFLAMFLIYAGGLAISLGAEFQRNPVFGLGGMMEGKELRFGVTNSIIWSTATTVASNGSVNAMHSSLSPLAGGVAMLNIHLGEIIFGGVGSGLYGMLLFVLLTVFLAGLMVGRTPEYLGKKIETREIKMVILAILIPNAVILLGTALACVTPAGLSSLANKGPHGFSEMLYAFTSAAGNNGSAFAGLNANTVFYNVLLGISMLLGRFGVIIPALAVAGSLAAKKWAPASEGSFSTDNGIFLLLLVSVILIVGALTFFPALSLGPVVEHFLMRLGISF